MPLSPRKQPLVSRSSNAKLCELLLKAIFQPEVTDRISFEPCFCWPQRSKLPCSLRQHDSPCDCLHSTCSFHLPGKESLKSGNYCDISHLTTKHWSSTKMLQFMYLLFEICCFFKWPLEPLTQSYFSRDFFLGQNYSELVHSILSEMEILTCILLTHMYLEDFLFFQIVTVRGGGAVWSFTNRNWIQRSWI